MYGYGVFRYRAYCKNCCCNQRLKSKCANPVKIAFYTVLRWLKHPFFCCLVKKKKTDAKKERERKSEGMVDRPKLIQKLGNSEANR